MLNPPLSSIIVLTFHLALSNVSPTSYSCNNCYIPEGSTWSHQPWSRLLSTCFLNFLVSFLLLVWHLTVNRRILDGPRGCQSLVLQAKIVQTKRTLFSCWHIFWCGGFYAKFLYISFVVLNFNQIPCRYRRSKLREQWSASAFRVFVEDNAEKGKEPFCAIVSYKKRRF